MKKLILAEKPSVGRDIARVLKCEKGGNGYLEGDSYVVTWALGHLVTLADPELYDKKYSTWNLADLPMLPAPLRLVIMKQTGKQFNVVDSLVSRKDINEIIIATDAGREGELVARWILEKIKMKKPLKRLWISSVTDQAIREGFRALRDGRLYENLYASAAARSEADWYVGINGTRALTSKYNAQLSCGRVQTPTLSMLGMREKEISAFQPKPFWGLQALADGFKLTWMDEKSHQSNCFDELRMSDILRKLSSASSGTVAQLEKTQKIVPPPALYDLTELQRDGNRLFGFSGKETLNIMQRLYEHHKILTYPRTDSRFISTDLVSTLKDRLKACGVGPYSSVALKLAMNPIVGKKHFVDNGKVSDHHAIIPTEQAFQLSALNTEERRIYDLVVKRFLAVLSPAHEYEQTSLTVRIGTEFFRSSGSVVRVPGWKSIYAPGETSDEDLPLSENIGAGIQNQQLPILKKGDSVSIRSVIKTNGFTSPPPFFTEGTLLSAMENPIKYMPAENLEMIKIIGEAGGIGTVATRADIIEKLLNSFLIEKKGKTLHITSKGKQLLELVPKDLKSPLLTAQWEKKLDQIAKGTLKKAQFIEEIKSYAASVVTEIRGSEKNFRHDNVTREKCPECGKFLLEVNGKKGKMLVCPDRECGHRKGVSRVTNARCPVCHKKLELRGSGDAQIFVCSCGHREKLSAFNSRRNDSPTKADKNDVKRYLANQNKNEKAPEDLANSPFAALLSLKIDKE